MKLTEKVAIVTGGSGGIGEAICLRLAQEGAKIVINYRSHPDQAQDTKEKIEQTGSQAHIIKTNLGKVEEINNLVAKSINHFGKVDILVNSAGLEKRADFWDVTEEDYDLVMNVNSRVLKDTAAHRTDGSQITPP